MAASSKTTTDHTVIRNRVEERGGKGSRFFKLVSRGTADNR